MATTAAKWEPKDPADIADYTVNWRAASAFLAPGVTITTSVAVIEEPQPDPGDGYTTLSIVGQDFVGDISVVRFAGGSTTAKYLTTTEIPRGLDPGKYPVMFDIDVSTGEHFQTTVVLTVKERIKK